MVNSDQFKGCLACLGRKQGSEEVPSGSSDLSLVVLTTPPVWRGAYADLPMFRDPTGIFFHSPPPLRPVGSSHKLRVIYLIPTNRQPTSRWREKITTVMTFVADIYRENFKRKGIPGGELDHEFDADGQLLVHLLNSNLNTAAFQDPSGTDARQWPQVEAEVNRRFGRPEASKRIHVIFAETYGLGPSPFEYPWGVARGCKFSPDGGMGVFSAWILRDEFCAPSVPEQLRLLNDETPIQGRTALGHGYPNSPRHHFIQDGIGAVVHEVGHALGLFHDMRKDDEYIMGNGFRCIRHNYVVRFSSRPRVGFSDDNLRMLQYSRFLAPPRPPPKGLNLARLLLVEQKPSVVVYLPRNLTAGTMSFSVQLEARSDQELGAVVLHHQEKGSVVGGALLEGKYVKCDIPVLIEPLPPGPFGLLAIVTDRTGCEGNYEARCML